MTGLCIEFVAVDNRGAPAGAQIGALDDAPFVPRVHELVSLGGEDWQVVDVRWELRPGVMCAVLTVRRTIYREGR